MSFPIIFKAYRTAVSVLEPAVLGLLYWRRHKGREDRTRLGERQGHPSRQRPKGHLMWVHGASIGETLHAYERAYAEKLGAPPLPPYRTSPGSSGVHSEGERQDIAVPITAVIQTMRQGAHQVHPQAANGPQLDWRIFRENEHVALVIEQNGGDRRFSLLQLKGLQFLSATL